MSSTWISAIPWGLESLSSRNWRSDIHRLNLLNPSRCPNMFSTLNYLWPFLPMDITWLLGCVSWCWECFSFSFIKDESLVSNAFFRNPKVLGRSPNVPHSLSTSRREEWKVQTENSWGLHAMPHLPTKKENLALGRGPGNPGVSLGTSVRCHHTPSGTPKIKKTDCAKCLWRCGRTWTHPLLLGM